MNNEKVTERQAISVIAMFTVGTAMITGVAKPAEENAWIALILATFLSIPIQLMYARMLSNYPGKNILEITEIIFGKILSKVFGVIFLWNGIYLSALLIKIFDQFMIFIGLNSTPEMVIITLIILLLMQMLKSGVTVFGKWSELFLYLLIITFIFITLNLMPLKKIDNLIPIMYDGFKPVWEGTIYTIAFPLTQTALFLLFFHNFSNKKSYYKVFTFGMIIGSFLLLIMTLDVISIIGKINYVNSLFPPYVTLRRLQIGTFFQRVEMLLLLVFIYVAFIKVASSTFSALISLQYIFNLKTYKTLVIPMSLLVGILAYLSYSDYLDHEYIAPQVYVPYSIVVNICIPFIIFIAEEIHLKLNKKKNKQ